MNDMNELIESVDAILEKFDHILDNSKMSLNVESLLEKYSWDVLRMLNDLREIKAYVGGN